MSQSRWERDRHLHHPFFCEENVWHLLRATPTAAWAVFIRAPHGPVWMTMQRPAAPSDVIGWDYHVIALVEGTPARVADLDSHLPFPCPLDRYLQESFPSVAPPEGRPRFRVVSSEAYRAGLRTDRRHMKDAEGRWVHPPPPWPPLTPGEHDLEAWLSPDAAEWVDAATLLARWGGALSS